MDLTAIAPQLRETEPGMWMAEALVEVAYPATGHRELMEIEDRSFWFGHRADVISMILHRFPPAGCVFDVGGGNGYVARRLRGEGWQSIVVEPGADGARAALDRGLAPVVNATTDTAGFLPETMPALGLFDVLEHVDNDVAFLVHLRHLLRPGGRIYLTVPAHQWLWSMHDVRADHYRRYTAPSLRHVMEAAGFVVEYDTYLFGPLLLPILLLRAIPSRLRLRGTEGSRAGGHVLPGGLTGRVIQRTLERELRRLRIGRVGLGSSVLLVGTKAD